MPTIPGNIRGTPTDLGSANALTWHLECMFAWRLGDPLRDDEGCNRNGNLVLGSLAPTPARLKLSVCLLVPPLPAIVHIGQERRKESQKAARPGRLFENQSKS